MRTQLLMVEQVKSLNRCAGLLALLMRFGKLGRNHVLQAGIPRQAKDVSPYRPNSTRGVARKA